MQIDPVEEWRRLTEHYRQMSDGELQELALDVADLTEVAQQVLGGELRHRGLDRLRASDQASTSTPASTGINRAQGRQRGPFAAPAEDADTTADAEEAGDEDDGAPREYTWKTVLCECEEWDQVWQLQEMLRRAGIQSWYQGPPGGLIYPRIFVAADQLEEARIVVARPIPQDVIDESHEQPEEYEMPCCPACGTQDPVLEGTDPSNSWRCEACGRRWSDPAPAAEAQPQPAGS